MLNYNRSLATDGMVPGRGWFLTLSIMGMLSVFVPLLEPDGVSCCGQLWQLLSELRYGFAMTRVLEILVVAACFFLPWPLTILKLRLLSAQPWDPVEVSLAGIVAVAACVAPPLVACYYFFSDLGLNLLTPARMAYMAAPLWSAILGACLATGLWRRYDLATALHAMILACYAGLPTVVTLQGLAHVRLAGSLRGRYTWGCYGMVLLAVGSIVELLAWSRMLRRRDPVR